MHYGLFDTVIADGRTGFESKVLNHIVLHALAGQIPRNSSIVLLCTIAVLLIAAHHAYSPSLLTGIKNAGSTNSGHERFLVKSKAEPAMSSGICMGTESASAVG
ncbi:hypothetical protein ACLUVW_01115 [Bifidobacterium pseudolongum subsp. globosum]|uniref:hypothetical protein n=1 Tax=Bifidobacterium pseudolongum TaxID=1694 RepID=UPI003991CCA3